MLGMRLTTLDQAIRATPRDAVLWLRLGDDLSARGKLLQAREAYARASRLRPHWLIARLRLTQLPPHPVSEDAPTTATPIGHNSTEDDWFDNLGWDAIPLTPRDVDATAEATEATTNVRQVPRVAHVPPRHVYVQPRPVVVHPAPIYVQPRPVYVQPHPVFIRPPAHGHHHGKLRHGWRQAQWERAHAHGHRGPKGHGGHRH